jgi:hypothetical protein
MFSKPPERFVTDIEVRVAAPQPDARWPFVLLYLFCVGGNAWHFVQ